MSKRGRIRQEFSRPDQCTYCEGRKYHYNNSKDCGACDGTGLLKVQKQLDNVYKAKNGLPLRQKTN